MKIRGIEVDVDVKYELEQFSWERATWTEERLICNSPFRQDSHPSFFVRLKAYGDIPDGVWSDSGSIDDHWHSGAFPRLYGWLRGITEEEAEEYLLETYSNVEIGYREKLEIKTPTLLMKEKRKYIENKTLDRFTKNFDYLLSRGIPEHIAEKREIYFDQERRAIAIPWRDASGRICNIKYRRTDSKIFWYEKGYTPISQLVYGLDEVYKENHEKVVVTEAEIDALTMMKVNPAIALGGSNFSERKAQLIIKSPIKHLIIATDNDQVGRKVAYQIAKRLGNYVQISLYQFPSGIKDLNDIENTDILKQGISNAKPMKQFGGLTL